MSWKLRGARGRLTMLGLLVAATLALGSFGTRAVAPLEAAADIPPAGPKICTYYSDRTFTEVIGVRGVGCCGEVIERGDTSLYARCEILYCPDVVCPQ